MTAAAAAIPSGIAPFDDRMDGLESGGSYLVVGAPGPAKMVAALQFLHAGVTGGEPALLVTNADAEGILEAARAWGLPMRDAWENGTLQIVGFRSDFELRAIRSIAPDEVLEELESIVVGRPARIAVDPGTMFLAGGTRTILAAAFIGWLRQRAATSLVTFSVDSAATSLPPSADWLLNATTGRLILTRDGGALHQIALERTLPDDTAPDRSITVELKPGQGLVAPTERPARRGADRGPVDNDHLLLVSLGDAHAPDFDAWARRAFRTDVVAEPFDAVAKVQEAGADYGCVLLHANRRAVRDAVRVCRGLRPLTRAAIVFASDDTVRSTDRINILEAGADDCLSGSLDFRELAVRIRQAIASGAKAPEPADDVVVVEQPRVVVSSDGHVTREQLAREVGRRAEDPSASFFCLLEVASDGLGSERLGEGLVELVRTEEGDLVSAGDEDRCLVLLQGARKGRLDAFISRMRAHVASMPGVDGEPHLEVTVLAHPADAKQIEALLGTELDDADE